MALGLRIRLFGELALGCDEGALPPMESARAESLLAYLILHRDTPVARQRLAFLLWPDSTERQARTNLRHVLHNLRRALPDPEGLLEVTHRTLQWRATAACWVDVVASRRRSRGPAGIQTPSGHCERLSISTPATWWKEATTSGSSPTASDFGSAISAR